MVKCQKCGQENDSDAGFCENCGANLNSAQGKSAETKVKKSTHVLILACVVLIVALGVSGATLLQMNKQAVVNTTNTSNITVNSSANHSQTAQNNSKETNHGITASQAASIALKYGKQAEPRGQWSVGSVDFVPAPNFKNTANYMVELSNDGPVKSGVARAMDVRINAQTGTIMQ